MFCPEELTNKGETVEQKILFKLRKTLFKSPMIKKEKKINDRITNIIVSITT